MANISSKASDGMRGAQVVGEQSLVEADQRASSVGRRVWTFLSGPYPTLLSRLVLGGIFLIYGFSKLNSPLQFANDIHAYQMGIPQAVENIMARTLPIVEIGLGIWLLAGLFTRFSAIIATALMAVFTTAITQAWIRGIDANCGCIGGATGSGSTDFITGLMKALGPVGDFFTYEKIGPVPVLRDLLLLFMGLHLIFVPTIFALDDLRKRYVRTRG